jgi:hypothetical protein
VAVGTVAAHDLDAWWRIEEDWAYSGCGGCLGEHLVVRVAGQVRG